MYTSRNNSTRIRQLFEGLVKSLNKLYVEFQKVLLVQKMIEFYDYSIEIKPWKIFIISGMIAKQANKYH